MIDRIIVLILSIGTFYAMYKSIEKLSGKKPEKKKNRILSLVIFSCIYVPLYVKNIGIYGIWPVIYIGITTKYYLKLNIKEWIYYMVVIYLLGVILDITIMLGVNGLLKGGIIEEESISSIQILGSVGMLGFYVYLANSRKLKRIFQKLYKKFNKINLSVVGMIFVIIIYGILDFICLTKIKSTSVVGVLLMITTLGFIVSIICIIHVYRIKALKETVNLLIKNNEFYINIINEYRIVKHNLINQLLGIKSQANKKTEKLINELIMEYNNTFKNVKDIKSIPAGINGIIYEKIYSEEEADKINIEVENRIKGNILQSLSSKKYNVLCEAIGVILDNAMEETIKSNDKLLYIKLSEDEKRIKIVIENTFKGSIDIDEIGKINYTSKKDGNGLGLFSIFSRKEIQLTTSIRNNRFISRLEMDKEL